MRSLLAVAVATAGAVVMAQGGQPSLSQSGHGSVPIYATVIDSAGRLVDELRSSDFEITDSGVRSAVTLFSHERRRFSAGSVVDVGTGAASHTAAVFTDRFFTHDLDRVRELERTTGRSELAIGLVLHALDESVWDVAETVMNHPLMQAETGRRVLIVVTDGRNVISTPAEVGPFDDKMPSWSARGAGRSAGDIQKRAEREGAIVYVVEFEGKGASFNGSLRKLAVNTGGRVLRVRPADDPVQMANALSDEVNQQYLLGFTPAVLDGKVHKIEVRALRPGLTLTARKTYVAEKR